MRLFLAAFVGVLFIGCIGTFGLFVYTTSPRPAPPPWPGAVVQVGTPGVIGSFGLARDTTYTIDLHLDDVRRYYEHQMLRYCSELPSWENRDKNGRFCLVSDWCQIRRWQGEQYFYVTLCEHSDQQLDVTQTDIWAD